MSDGSTKGQMPERPANLSAGISSGPGAQNTVEAFASQVLSVVASRSQISRSTIRGDILDELLDAVAAFDSAPRVAFLETCREAKISDAMLVDEYLPAAARKLGAAWCEDDMSFADVTIGSARLQAMLRDLRAPQVDDLKALNVLIVVPQDAYHTLGAAVVADQLRRLGVAPTLALGLDRDELAELVESHDFNAVMISAAACERLETLRTIVDCVRGATRSVVPIILGGTVSEKDTDILTLTGADYVSTNPKEALQACGLMIPMRAVEPPGHRG